MTAKIIKCRQSLFLNEENSVTAKDVKNSDANMANIQSTPYSILRPPYLYFETDQLVYIKMYPFPLLKKQSYIHITTRPAREPGHIHHTL